MGNEINLKTDGGESNFLPGIVHQRMSNGLLDFHSFWGMEGKFSGGVTEIFSKGVGD